MACRWISGECQIFLWQISPQFHDGVYLLGAVGLKSKHKLLIHWRKVAHFTKECYQTVRKTQGATRLILLKSKFSIKKMNSLKLNEKDTIHSDFVVWITKYCHLNLGCSNAKKKWFLSEIYCIIFEQRILRMDLSNNSDKL